MVVALTGGTGFLGRRVAAQLGDRTLRLDRGHPALTTATALAEHLADTGVDTVVHLAARYVRHHGPDDLDDLLASNIALGATLLEASRLAGVGRVVMADSPFAWAGPEGRTAVNLYGATRQALAALADWYAQAYPLTVVRLVVHDLYGPDDPRPKLLPALLRARATGTPVRVVRHGPPMDLLHVDDAVRGVLHACHPDVPGGAWALRSSTLVSPWSLAERLERAGSRPVPREALDLPPPGLRVLPWPGDDLPGWAPEVPLDDGLAALCGAR